MKWLIGSLVFSVFFCAPSAVAERKVLEISPANQTKPQTCWLAVSSMLFDYLEVDGPHRPTEREILHKYHGSACMNC
jgi:hypothetical protein